MKCNFKNRMFKGATVLMAAGMIATTSAPAVQAAAPSVMSIVQQAMSMGVAATEVESGTWCDGITYVLDSDGTLTFSGTGELRGRQWDKSIQVKKVVIGEGITQILMSFSDFTSLTSINIPDSVTIIGDSAFSGCYNLQYINGGNNVTTIESQGPYGNFYVNTLNIPEDKRSQDYKLITYLTTTSDTLKNYNWAADNRTFTSTDPSTPSDSNSCGTDATFVKSDDGTVTIEGTGKIDDSAFKDHADVTKVVISEGITEIGNETFKNMNNLETVTLPDSVDKIGDSAFGNDTNLSEVNGGSDTITVADNAFAMDDYSIATQPLVVESKAVYNSIMKTPRKNVSLKNGGSTTPVTPGTVTPPLAPAAENWSYSDVNNQFETDKFSIPSETADWNIIMNENYNVNGLSEKQGYKSMYSKATSNSEDTVVVCDKASHWMIAIPKDIVLDGASAESTADYRVGIAGEVDPAKRVTVTPDQTVTLVNQGNDQITYVATVDQPVTGVNGFDIVENFADAGDTLMNGHISATIKRAGSYKGNMSFAIDYVDYVQGASTPESATRG